MTTSWRLVKRVLNLAGLIIISLPYLGSELTFPTVQCHPWNSMFVDGICVKCVKLHRSIKPLNGSLVDTVTCLKSELNQRQFRVKQGADYLSNRLVRIVSIPRSPFVKVEDGRYSGVCYELIYAIRDKYNFSTVTSPPYDGNWGAQASNGTWNGMVGQVLRKEADIGVAGFSVTFGRAQVIEFTFSYHQEPSGILIPPPTEGEKLSVLIRPLSYKVWICVGLTILILAPTLYLLHITSLWIMGEKSNKSGFYIITELIYFMVGSLVQESVISPVNKTTRFLIFNWWVLTLVIANIYVAYLVSYLSSPQYFNIVNSLEDLVNQNKIKWTFRLNTAHQSLFKSESSSGIYKQIGDRVSEADLVNTDLDGVARVLKGKYAFIKEMSFIDVALGQDYLQNKECRMSVAKQTFFKVETALIVQKRSEFIHVINYETSQTVATGLMEKWKSIHWPREVWCKDATTFIPSTKPKTRKLGLEDVQGAYFLFTCGMVPSLLVFLMENLIHKLGGRKRIKRIFMK